MRRYRFLLALASAACSDPTLVDDAGARDVPTVDTSGLDVPGLDAPGLDAPGADVPGVDAPGVDGGGTCPTLVTGLAPLPATLGTPRPALNVPYVDENFGTTIRRVTDPSLVVDRDPPSFVRNEYSRRPAFNADGTRALMISSNGWLRLYDVATDGRFTFVETVGLADTQEPNWHPEDADRFYYLGREGAGMQIHERNVATDADAVFRDLATRITGLFPDAASAWTGGEGRPSDDGRVWCFMVDDDDAGPVGLVAYDAVEDRILGSMPISVRPDHVSTSPSGTYCVPSWSENELGTRAYATDFSDFTQLHHTSQHSDLAVTAEGREVLVYSDYLSGFLEMVDLASGAHTPLVDLYLEDASSISLHVSGTAIDRDGWVVVSFYGCREDGGDAPCDLDQQWYENQIVALSLEAGPRVVRLADAHRVDAGYFGQPLAVANRDLTRVLFGSSWESSDSANIAAYAIEVPACALE